MVGRSASPPAKVARWAGGFASVLPASFTQPGLEGWGRRAAYGGICHVFSGVGQALQACLRRWCSLQRPTFRPYWLLMLRGISWVVY